MRIAIIGQSAFSVDVMLALHKNHEIVAVFTIPDKNGRQEILALEAARLGIPVIKRAFWRRKLANGKFEILPEAMNEYLKFNAELNVLPFCAQFIPLEVSEAPKYKSIAYHPSILPAHRGASAINWTIISGDAQAGFTIFWPDEGLDTGPILLQKKTNVREDDTLSNLYKRFLYPAGVKAIAEAVNLIAAGKAPHITQSEVGASYEPRISTKPELAQLDWGNTQRQMHDFIRGNDSVPGAWAILNGKKVTFYSAKLYKKSSLPKNATAVPVDEVPGGAVYVHSGGLLLPSSDGAYVIVETIMMEDGGTVPGKMYGSKDIHMEKLAFTDTELGLKNRIGEIWKAILGVEIDETTDFFACGATSQDVTRLIEETRFISGVELETAKVYGAPVFEQYVEAVIRKLRGEDELQIVYDPIKLSVNNLELVFPHQMFIDGAFVDGESDQWTETINPTTEEVICSVPRANQEDVDLAVQAAIDAFEKGEWGQLSARERGKLLFKLADLMEMHKEELATLESIDCGAVYTLALKTHIGMSIDVWRYFAAWTDKIEGRTIPISNARPNQNLCLTVREPIGVCGIIIPWNYPLMMLSWKMAACLAAGNTVVLKPAEVTPLTALKFAELSVKAGIPHGVINIVTGLGAEVGHALCEHPEVRKVAFTGSTTVGKKVMMSGALSNVKKVSLELGGKSPLIIFADADLERATKQACNAVFFNKGENCIAAGRIFVAESIYDEFIKRVVNEAKHLVIGDPLDRRTSHGPQNHLVHLNKLINFVKQGVEDGAKIAHGGKRPNRLGLFFEPTVLVDVEDDNYVAKVESFGPIMVVSKFFDDDIDDVIQRANATEYGLAAGIFSKDISKILRITKRLQAGTVFINTYQKTDVAAPFGGFKQSGFGKDLGEDALNDYLRTKTITIEY